jgi:hypothetical protein
LPFLTSQVLCLRESCMRENRTCSLSGGRRLARKRASSDPTGADSAVQGYSQAGRIPGRPVLPVVLTYGALSARRRHLGFCPGSSHRHRLNDQDTRRVWRAFPLPAPLQFAEFSGLIRAAETAGLVRVRPGASPPPVSPRLDANRLVRSVPGSRRNVKTFRNHSPAVRLRNCGDFTAFRQSRTSENGRGELSAE